MIENEMKNCNSYFVILSIIFSACLWIMISSERLMMRSTGGPLWTLNYYLNQSDLIFLRNYRKQKLLIDKVHMPVTKWWLRTKGTVVNRALPSLHEGSLEMTLKVTLMTKIWKGFTWKRILIFNYILRVKKRINVPFASNCWPDTGKQ